MRRQAELTPSAMAFMMRALRAFVASLWGDCCSSRGITCTGVAQLEVGAGVSNSQVVSTAYTVREADASSPFVRKIAWRSSRVSSGATSEVIKARH